MPQNETTDIYKKNAIKDADKSKRAEEKAREKSGLDSKIKEFTNEISELEGRNKLVVSEMLRKSLEYVNGNKLHSKDSDSILKDHFLEGGSLHKFLSKFNDQVKALVVDIMYNLPSDDVEEVHPIVYALLLANFKPDEKIASSTNILPPIDGGKFSKYYMNGVDSLGDITIYVPERLEGRTHLPVYKNLLTRLFTLKVFTHFLSAGASAKIVSGVHNAMFKELSEQHQAILARKFRKEEPVEKVSKKKKEATDSTSSEDDDSEQKKHVSKPKKGKKKQGSESSADEEKKFKQDTSDEDE